MKRIRTVLIIALLAAVALAGCAGQQDFVTNSYKTLASAQVFYDQGLTAAAQAEQLGLLDEQGKRNVIEVGDAYRAAWQEAAELLYLYSITEVDKSTVEEKMAVFLEVYTRFARLAQPYLIKALTQ